SDLLLPERDIVREAEASRALCTATAGEKAPSPSLVWRSDAGNALLVRLRALVARQPRAERLISFDRLGRELEVRSRLLAPWLHALWSIASPEGAYLRAHARLDRAGLVVHPGTVSFTAEEQRLAAWLVELLQGAGLSPARLREYAKQYGARPDLLERVSVKLAEQGRVVRISPDFALHHTAADELHRAAAALPREGVTAAGFGKALGLSRKYSIPYLEYLNAQGVVRRDGDLHVPA
ncbi:MAG: SelB C-terminal domain-containing protein, partial [Gemmatimonadetes bacterium]|nr:SelB C-terminal domain-containing protein [Gemmatimonadota bacterium]